MKDERKSSIFRWLVSLSRYSLMPFLIKNLDLGDLVEGKRRNVIVKENSFLMCI